MLAALGTLATERRIAVGDGGTRAGILAAAGRARLASGRAFPLIGVAPARELAPAGSTPVDPNHSHVIAVDDPALPTGEPAWGSETATMYWLFNRFAEGRNSVAIVANGGGITLDEIAANVEFGRPMILIAGSGGAADALVALVRGTTPADSEVRRPAEQGADGPADAPSGPVHHRADRRRARPVSSRRCARRSVRRCRGRRSRRR